MIFCLSEEDEARKKRGELASMWRDEEDGRWW